MPTSIGQVLVNEILPPKYQDYKRTLGAKELESMLAQIASEDPSIYKDVSAKLMRLGNKAAYESGTTLRLSDILPPFDKSVVLKQLNAQEDKIRANPKLTDEQKSELLENLYDKINDLIKEQTYETSAAVRNPFAMQVKSKARGNKDQLAAMISTPGIYSDSHGKVVPMFIQHSYAEGLTPAEYWAGSFGARLGVVSCLTPDTQILLWEGKKAIKLGDVKVGDEIVGWGKWAMKPVKVVHVFDNGIQPVYRFRFGCGDQESDDMPYVDATLEHKMLAYVGSEGWRTKESLYDLHEVELFKFKDIIDHDMLLYRPNGMQYHVVTVESLGRLPVMDIEVDSPEHVFMLAAGGLISSNSKFATAQGGYLGKLLDQAAISEVVTEDDCGGAYGLPVQADDTDNIGAVLQRPVAGFDAGTVIDKDVLSELKKQKVDEIIIRSPTTCACQNGVCSKCCGIRETGGFPPLGYNLGINAASALSERIAQGALNTKHCLECSTPIIYGDFSIHKLSDVTVGDTVMGCGKDGVMRPVKVLNVWHNGKKEVYRTYFKQARTRTGRTLYVDSTLDHKILATAKKYNNDHASTRELGLLPVGTFPKGIFSAYSVTHFDDTGLHDCKFDYLIGALIGDGCYTESVSGVHLSCDDTLEIAELNASLVGTGMSLNQLKYHNGIYYRVSGGSDQGDRLGNPVKNFLVKHGMYGKYAQEKEIPEVVDTWSNSSVAHLLGGLFAADGSVYKTRGATTGQKVGVAFSSTSRKLVEQVKRLLLLRFGIWTSGITITAHAGERHGTFDRKFSQHQITVTPASLTEFNRVIHIPGRKAAILNNGLDGFESPSKNFFMREYSEYLGELDTMDIEVDHPDHMFVLANGLIVSNSGKKAKGKSEYSGFDAIKNMTTVPGTYKDAAVVAKEDGKVTEIYKAPQGGYYVYVGDKKQYVKPGYDLLVKEGDELEAGDQISDGVLNPADVVNYKGIGEGRRYFTNRFTQMMRDSNYAVNRRNVEAVARALVNHVQVDDEDAEAQMLPGDITTYSSWSFGYKPRPNTKYQSPQQSVGQYLESPVLHYTIGTKISRKMANDLKKYGVDQIFANPNPVAVTPVMQSVVKSTGDSDDWMARLGTTYLKTRLTEDAQHGAKSNLHSTNPFPGVAKGVEFGNYFDPGVKRTGGYTY